MCLCLQICFTLSAVPKEVLSGHTHAQIIFLRTQLLQHNREAHCVRQCGMQITHLTYLCSGKAFVTNSVPFVKMLDKCLSFLPPTFSQPNSWPNSELHLSLWLLPPISTIKILIINCSNMQYLYC